MNNYWPIISTVINRILINDRLSPALTNYLISYVELNPSWEVNSFSASQEIPIILWNPELHYRFNKSTPLVPILNHMNQAHTLPLYFFNNYFNIIPNLSLGLPRCIFFQVFLPKLCMPYSFFHAFYISCPSNSPWFDGSDNLFSDEE
jgi:hypothetical protein